MVFETKKFIVLAMENWISKETGFFEYWISKETGFFEYWFENILGF
jgi:hypothetical protein